MLTRMRARLFVILLAACGHSKAAEPTTPTAKAAPGCDVVGQHVVSVLPNHNESNAELSKKVQDVFTDSCTKDAWSPEGRTCMVDAKDMQALDACEPKFTEAQTNSLKQQLSVILGGPAAEPPPMPAPVEAAPPPAAPPPAKATRGPQKKGKTGDPCEGGQ